MSIHAHPLFKLGRKDPVRDSRNIKFSNVLTSPLAVPRQYDFDLAHPAIPTPSFANDRYGCCVIAARAHITLRQELIEAGNHLGISDQEVVREYLAESGGSDEGLETLTSLKAWCNRGWMAASRRHFIFVFAEIQPTQHELIRQAVYMDAGVLLGLSLPLTAQAQIQAGRSWDVATYGSATAPGSWGGHLVAVTGYTAAGPVCVTWGRKQQMTWAFVDRYCDEAYAVFASTENAKMAEALDLPKTKSALAKAGIQ